MKTVVVYECSKCGRKFTTEEECAKCEASHVTKGTLVDEIYPSEDKHYSNDFPEAILWQSPDGKRVKYVFPSPKHASKHTSTHSIRKVTTADGKER